MRMHFSGLHRIISALHQQDITPALEYVLFTSQKHRQLIHILGGQKITENSLLLVTHLSSSVSTVLNTFDFSFPHPPPMSPLLDHTPVQIF